MLHRASRDLTRLAALAAATGIACSGDGPPSSPSPEPARAIAPPRTPSLPPVLPEPPEVPAAPAQLPPTPSPDHNPTTPEKVALGLLLFFDPRLSGTDAMSCASCHVPELGWADGKRLSTTAAGALNLRHTPSLINTGYATAWFWDGRIGLLEEQILSSWQGQMSAHPDHVADRLAEIPEYRAHFARAFAGAAPNRHRVVEALAAFVRTIRSEPSAWDRHEVGEAGAVSELAIRGFALFSERAGCAVCHAPPLYTDNSFHGIAGRLDRKAGAARDPGRARVTGRAEDVGAFKTPGLRGVASTAPYFHDGSADTLADVVRIETRFVFPALDAVEIAAIVEFLESLSPPPVTPYRRPRLPGGPGTASEGDAGPGPVVPSDAGQPGGGDGGL